MGYSEIQEFLSYEQRESLIIDIKRYYRGDYLWNKKLRRKKDRELLTMRESMRKSGKIRGYLKDYSIHLNVIMNDFKANKYLVRPYSDNTRLYIGENNNSTDRLGRPENIQYGYIETNQDWKIVDVEMLGKKTKSYNGLRLITSWNYVK